MQVIQPDSNTNSKGSVYWHSAGLKIFTLTYSRYGIRLPPDSFSGNPWDSLAPFLDRSGIGIAFIAELVCQYQLNRQWKIIHRAVWYSGSERSVVTSSFEYIRAVLSRNWYALISKRFNLCSYRSNPRKACTGIAPYLTVYSSVHDEARKYAYSGEIIWMDQKGTWLLTESYIQRGFEAGNYLFARKIYREIR